MTNRIRALLEQQDIRYTSASTISESASACLGIATARPQGTPAAACNSFFSPLHYEPNYAYPLLVWLHGSGDDETQLRRVMPLVSMRNYVAVAPRGTLTAPGQSSQSGYCWPQSQGHINRASGRVLDAVEKAKAKFNVAPNRIFLAGYDDGGTMALRLAFQHPRQFAGVISIGGALPRGQAPLSRIHEARHVPVFVACGRSGQRYATDEICDNLRLLHTAGISVTLRQYPCGDEVMPQMLSDMDRWVMEQILPPPPATDGLPDHQSFGGHN